MFAVPLHRLSETNHPSDWRCIMLIKQIPPSLIGGKTYFADENGNIQNAKGKILKPLFSTSNKNHRGGSVYPHVSLNVDKDIHSLVCAAFWGIRQSGQVCHHLDGNKFNNRPDNLIWLYPDEHRFYDKLVKQGVILKHVDPNELMEREMRQHREN